MRRFWTPAEDRQLTRLYATKSAAECAEALDRSESAVNMRVAKLGLTKSPEWIAGRARQRWAEGRHENSRKAQFRAGQAAWNKGLRGVVGVQDACRRTQFKPGTVQGRAAEIEQPIGAERVTKDGILQRKVNNDLPFQRRWKAVHAIVWEAANGPIPAGHVVIFRPGRATTDVAKIAVDGLELVSRGELMRRNSYHTRYPKEVAQLIQLKGALNRKINRRQKEAQP
jgi:hypothetical protein